LFLTLHTRSAPPLPLRSLFCELGPQSNSHKVDHGVLSGSSACATKLAQQDFVRRESASGGHG
jgi:hypothetical protein